MTATSFFWHDYETFGADPQRDRPCQFAGIRTDLEFNILDKPLMAYCRPPADYLPQPEACLITGITPQLALEQGLPEAEFAALIEQQLGLAGTCGIGYNSIRFDDEVTRNLLYRNFHDPYAREWQNGNSRWDLIDVVRACCALRPQGIEWPINDAGVASFRLELLTAANGIGHETAHDALSDVHATIALARLIKQRQPRLFEFLFRNRHKSAAAELLKTGSFTPLVHVSGRFPASKHHLAVILPLCEIPNRANEVVVYDLSNEPSALLELDAAAIRQRLFVASEQLPEGVERIPLKTVHLNKCPILAPLSVIRQEDAERLQLDLSRCLTHARQIQQASDLPTKLAEVFQREYSNDQDDPDLMIYSGGFFSRNDKAAMQRIRQSKPEQLATLQINFEDARLEQMLFRYRARNYPETLSASETQQWRAHCIARLNDDRQPMNLPTLLAKIAELRTINPHAESILQALSEYAAIKKAEYATPFDSETLETDHD